MSESYKKAIFHIRLNGSETKITLRTRKLLLLKTNKQRELVKILNSSREK